MLHPTEHTAIARALVGETAGSAARPQASRLICNPLVQSRANDGNTSEVVSGKTSTFREEILIHNRGSIQFVKAEAPAEATACVVLTAGAAADADRADDRSAAP